MMSGSSKGLPIKVPTIPIKVMTSNASQVSIILNILSIFRYVRESIGLLAKTCFDSGDFLTQQMS